MCGSKQYFILGALNCKIDYEIYIFLKIIGERFNFIGMKQESISAFFLLNGLVQCSIISKYWGSSRLR